MEHIGIFFPCPSLKEGLKKDVTIRSPSLKKDVDMTSGRREQFVVVFDWWTGDVLHKLHFWLNCCHRLILTPVTLSVKLEIMFASLGPSCWMWCFVIGPLPLLSPTSPPTTQAVVSVSPPRLTAV